MKGTMLLMATFLLLHHHHAHASGNGAGNGGGSVVCGDLVEMADVHEGRLRHKRKFVETERSVEEIIEKALWSFGRRQPTVTRLVEKEIKNFHKKSSYIESSTLDYTEDYNYIVIQTGCEYVQLAIWDDLSKNVLVRKDLFERMSNLNKAALILHEAIYSVFRKIYGHTNSDVSRMVNAYLLAEGEETAPGMPDVFYGSSSEENTSIMLDIPEDLDFFRRSYDLKIKLNKEELNAAAKSMKDETTRIQKEILSSGRKVNKDLYLQWKRANDAYRSYKDQIDSLKCDIKIIKELSGYNLQHFEESFRGKFQASLMSSLEAHEMNVLYGKESVMTIECNMKTEATIEIETASHSYLLKAESANYKLKFIRI